MPGGRPVKYLDPEGARKARLARSSINSIGPLPTPGSPKCPEDMIVSMPLAPSRLELPDTIPVWEPVSSETDCRVELHRVWGVILGTKVVSDWDDFLEQEAIHLKVHWLQTEVSQLHYISKVCHDVSILNNCHQRVCSLRAEINHRYNMLGGKAKESYSGHWEELWLASHTFCLILRHREEFVEIVMEKRNPGLY
ncbi:hypothetical protein M422DRAFT_54377 [Sphaerobolus stellatus SS14]|uniref:Uncharacterized protein n=1 Tax=Sphaerobolus stellatus (strain SS14) TaxID=990650 RepID=A0A0C9UV19_SPHS4|nr:hypothetical protein M422DRAFT_54377 [Sphaerobolus stellatus SS14]